MRENKLIAEFMGFQKVKIDYYGSKGETEFQVRHKRWLDKVQLNSVGTYIVHLKNNKWFEWSDVEYHKSFDWLIPVANKILILYTSNFGVIQKELRNDQSFIARMAVKQMFGVSSVTGKLEIDTVYLRCADFIKWYNTLPKEPR